MLDRTIPYGEVFGIQGVRFEQSGRLFSSQGTEMRRADTEEEIYVPMEVTQEPAETAPDESTGKRNDFRSMHWKPLKVLVESFGGEWTTKDAAVAYLEGRA